MENSCQLTDWLSREGGLLGFSFWRVRAKSSRNRTCSSDWMASGRALRTSSMASSTLAPRQIAYAAHGAGSAEAREAMHRDDMPLVEQMIEARTEKDRSHRRGSAH